MANEKMTISLVHQMTISKALKVKKSLAKDIEELTSSTNYCPIKFFVSYDKKEPYDKFTCTPEEKEQHIISDFQKFNALINRYNALCNALIDVNAKTMVKVPKFKSIDKILSDKEDKIEMEEISIAQAINRKDFYKNIYKNNILTFLHRSYTSSIEDNSKTKTKAKNVITHELEKRFPVDAVNGKANNWSDSKYTEAKESLEKAHEVVVIDPLNLVSLGGFHKVAEYINRYLIEIDDILNVANVTTLVEFEY